MTNAIITFTISHNGLEQKIPVKLNMDLLLFSNGNDKEFDLKCWINAAQQEPVVAMIACGVKIDITGRLE